MAYVPHIQVLAAGGDIANVLFAIVVVAFAIIGAIAKKREERKAEEEAQARRGAARKRRPEQQGRQQQGQQDEDSWVTVEDALPQNRSQPQRIGGDQPPKPLRQAPPVIENRQKIQQAEAATRQTEQHVRRLQAEAARAKAQASARHMPPLPPTRAAGLAASPASPYSTTSAAGEANVRVNLNQRKNARRAIIFHEILSPPKALRQDREFWET